MILKRNYKREEKKSFPVSRKNPAQSIVVASLGRCGSTMMYELLQMYGYRQTEFLKKFNDVTLDPNGYVYKTHDFPPGGLPENIRLIYLFGDPIDIVLSAHRQINWWGKTHHEYFGSDLFRENNDILIRDTLGLYRHFDLWYRPQRFSFISVKYEAMFYRKNIELLDDFLGFRLVLPPYKKRETDWTKHPEKDQLVKLYGELQERVNKAEDIKIWDAV